MTAAIISVFLTFVLITVGGGLFAQRWQHQNWIRQQHISGQDRRIAELKSIFVEFDSLLSRRLYRARRLLFALRRNSKAVTEERLKDYDSVVCEWNDKRNSLQIRLVRVISVSLAQDFEHDLSRRFIAIGSSLERLTRERLGDTRNAKLAVTLTSLEHELNTLSRSVYEFSRELYKRLQEEQDKVLLVDSKNKMPKDDEELRNVSTWFLFKTLFVPLPKSAVEA